jgi:hypothetical protein
MRIVKYNEHWTFSRFFSSSCFLFILSFLHLFVLSDSVMHLWYLKLWNGLFGDRKSYPQKHHKTKIPRTAELAVNAQLLRNVFLLFFIVAGALPGNDTYEAVSGKCFAPVYTASCRGSPCPEQDIFHKRFLLSEPWK